MISLMCRGGGESYRFCRYLKLLSYLTFRDTQKERDSISIEEIFLCSFFSSEIKVVFRKRRKKERKREKERTVI